MSDFPISGLCALNRPQRHMLEVLSTTFRAVDLASHMESSKLEACAAVGGSVLPERSVSTQTSR
eukprot:SAG31_NODE_765_length_12248_cov_6.802947_11_plen_64_part_00